MKKKILIRSDVFMGGGVETVLKNLSDYLYAKGCDLTIVTDKRTKAEFYQLYPKGIHYLRSSLIPDNCVLGKKLKWIPLRIINKLYRIYVQKKMQQHFDVAIAMKEGPSMLEVSKLCADKKFGWVHVDYTYLHWTTFLFPSAEEERKCMQNFDKIVCVSQAAADAVKAIVGDPGNLCVKMNPMDVASIERLAQKPCSWARPKDRPLFVSVGRLVEQKNYPLLIDICAELEKKYAFEMWIVGDGPDREQLEKQIRDRSITSVKLLGFQNNPYPYMKAADAYVSSAVWESYGLAIQESLILGVPVITTWCPAIEEVFDQRCGMLVDNSFDALYGAMEQVLQNGELLAQYQNEIQKVYRKESMYEERMQEICNLWEREA